MISITGQPTGVNYINQCAIWEMNVTGVVDETTDERNLYRLMNDDGAVTEWVMLPGVGAISVDMSREIAGVMETPLPGGGQTTDVSDMKKKFWIEYGSITYDKENCTKTEAMGNESGKSDFVNGYKNHGTQEFTARPDYIEVPRKPLDDFIYSSSGLGITIKKCDGSTSIKTMSGGGDITCYAIGLGNNSDLNALIKDIVWYEVRTGTTKIRYHVYDTERRTGGLRMSDGNASQVMFLEPSGGYSCLPIEHLERVGQSFTYDEICVVDGCNSGFRLKKKATADYQFSIRTPRTSQYGTWIQHFAASTKYFIKFAGNWVPFIITDVGEGFNYRESVLTVSGHIKMSV